MAARRPRYDMPLGQDTPNLASRDQQYGATASSGFNEPAFVTAFRETAGRIDSKLGELGQPIKPYLPATGRVLIVATFLEDSVRLLSQWGEQTRYLRNSRGIPYLLVVLYLFVNIVCMLGGSYSVISKRYLMYGVGALLFVVITQGFVYGLIFDLRFFFRNLSLIGGLLLVVSDAFAQDRRRLGLPGLPELDNKDRARYLQLVGRIMIILLFISHLARGSWTVVSTFVNILSLVACGLVVIGFRARFSASLLVALLFIQNLTSNSYWLLSRNNPHRDFLRYEYFQTLSIVGGLILLVNMGAGRISMDEKKKIY